MTEIKRRLVDQIIDPAYVIGLESKDISELRTMRDEVKEGENELSFERRLCQARVDILSAEIDRRSGRGGDDLVARLPEILASERSTTEGGQLPSRAPDYSVPRNADVPRRRVEEIVGEQTLARLGSLSVEEIQSIIASLGEHERKVSDKRRAVHEVVDRIQAEIVRRYTSGEADPAAALG